MKIAIDISQLVYPNTGVANYLKDLVLSLTKDSENEYVLFFSSLRGKLEESLEKKLKANGNTKIITAKMPPTALTFLWNKLHIFPIENFTGPIDFFITSDWAEAPTKKAKKGTILYDLIVYKYPEESNNETSFNLKKMLLKPNIVATQKQKLKWVKKESDIVFCISEATKKDAEEILEISKEKLVVVYPGLTL